MCWLISCLSSHKTKGRIHGHLSKLVWLRFSCCKSRGNEHGGNSEGIEKHLDGIIYRTSVYTQLIECCVAEQEGLRIETAGLGDGQGPYTYTGGPRCPKLISTRGNGPRRLPVGHGPGLLVNGCTENLRLLFFVEAVQHSRVNLPLRCTAEHALDNGTWSRDAS